MIASQINVKKIYFLVSVRIAVLPYFKKKIKLEPGIIPYPRKIKKETNVKHNNLSTKRKHGWIPITYNGKLSSDSKCRSKKRID